MPSYTLRLYTEGVATRYAHNSKTPLHSLAGPRRSAFLRLVLTAFTLLILPLLPRTLELLPERGHHLIAHRLLRRLREQRSHAAQPAHHRGDTGEMQGDTGEI